MDTLIEYIKSNPGVIPGIILVVIAFLDAQHASEQQDAAFDMPENSDTEKICRHIRLLETRIWLLGHWIVLSIGLVLIFV